jgi:hypothetical protein
MCEIRRWIFGCCDRQYWTATRMNNHCDPDGVTRCPQLHCFFMGRIRKVSIGECWRCQKAQARFSLTGVTLEEPYQRPLTRHEEAHNNRIGSLPEKLQEHDVTFNQGWLDPIFAIDPGQTLPSESAQDINGSSSGLFEPPIGPPGLTGLAGQYTFHSPSVPSRPPNGVFAQCLLPTQYGLSGDYQRQADRATGDSLWRERQDHLHWQLHPQSSTPWSATTNFTSQFLASMASFEDTASSTPSISTPRIYTHVDGQTGSDQYMGYTGLNDPSHSPPSRQSGQESEIPGSL